ncbi:MAG: glycosyltransferase [Chitinivibrionales bacterium]|nr:glycosyltransferase [Chitinivibrionales bacterium]
MITVAFLNQNYLVEQEVIKALRALPGVRLVVIDTAAYLNAEQARLTASVLAQQGCNLLFTINDNGMDLEGVLADFLERSAIAHVNWCVDDPFFLETIHNVPLVPRRNRLDFVSDRGTVAPLLQRGIKAFFLPLASDPDLFAPIAPPPPKTYGASFVGNSYVGGLEELIKDQVDFIEANIAFVNDCNKRYCTDIRFPLEAAANEYVGKLALKPPLSRQRAAFLIKHYVGYLYRKKMVLALTKRFPAFMVVGDQGWEGAVAPRQLLRDVRYYSGLNETYQKTAVNVDINRVVIRDGFTQRVFDCLAAGGFVITSPKPIVAEFFETAGPAQEIAVFDNEESLVEGIEYFLKHDTERTAIATRGRKKVLAEHTYNHRLQTLFKIVQKEL